MERVKEYDSAMTPEEVVARLKEKTVPVRFKLFPMGDWELRHHLDGTLGIGKDSSGRGVYASASLQIWQTNRGSHIVMKIGSSRMIDLFFAIAFLGLLPILVYKAERDYGRGRVAIFGYGFFILFLLGCAIWSWHEEKELIAFFESDILGIKK